jgi:NADH-quinone oxidoreductase subunit E
MKSNLEPLFQKFPNRLREDLIPLLQHIQDEFGYLSEDFITQVGGFLDISVNKIYGVATFYDNFRFGPVGRYHIRLCHGTACHVAGASNVLQELEKLLRIKAGETDKDGLFSLEVVSCIGACGLAPLIQINEEFFTGITVAKLENILASFRENDTISYES